MGISPELENNITERKLLVHVRSILSKSSHTTKLINKLEKVIKCDEILFWIWRGLAKLLAKNNESCDTFMLNVLELLEKISIRKSFDKSEQHEVREQKSSAKKFVVNFQELKKYERKVWQSLINRDFSVVIHKKLLFLLLENYLSRINNPIFLTDFLMSSMNVKGIIRILALQGVVTLMQKHNIEYPNLYQKLYTMFEPTIFHNKYKSRLFYLANILLSSTHLPEILVASFAKRTSRLSLLSASSDTPVILRFVGNLLLRHTGLQKMIHHPQHLKVDEDPFLMTEEDPLKTRATESSLWEFALLNNHCQPSVASASKFIHFNLPSLEFDLSEVLDNSYKNMFESESKKKKQKLSLTFERPQETVAKLKDDKVFKLWSLTK